eukprot:g14501.t1
MIFVVSSINIFLNYQELSEKHKQSGVKFQNLYNRIEEEVSQYKQLRSNAVEFLRDCNKVYTSVISESPNISARELKEFKNTFKNSSISKPTILDSLTHIVPVKSKGIERGTPLQDMAENLCTVVKITDDITDEDIININKIHIVILTNERHVQKINKRLCLIDKLHDNEISVVSIEHVEDKNFLTDLFRDEFWRYTTERFFTIEKWLKSFGITESFIHIENDVLLYSDPLALSFTKGMYIIKDTPTRGIGSVIFSTVSDWHAFIKYAEGCTPPKNDMEILGGYKDAFLLPCDPNNASRLVFDGAAFGQYIAGVDSRNIKSNTELTLYANPTVGFVNETSVVKADHSFNGTYTSLLHSESVIRVYAQNISVYHEKLSLLPIGIANSMFKHGDTLSLYKTMSSTFINKKESNIFMSALQPTHRVRTLIDITSTNFKLSPKMNYKDYLVELSRHYFCFCPRGNGIDTHRFWEALYLGVIPVIVNTPESDMSIFVEYLKDLGLPFYQVTDLDFFKKNTNEFFSKDLYDSITGNKFIQCNQNLKLTNYLAT